MDGNGTNPDPVDRADTAWVLVKLLKFAQITNKLPKNNLFQVSTALIFIMVKKFYWKL